MPEATRELTGKMRNSNIHPIFDDIADVVDSFTDLWNRRNGFQQTLFPVAKRYGMMYVSWPMVYGLCGMGYGV